MSGTASTEEAAVYASIRMWRDEYDRRQEVIEVKQQAKQTKQDVVETAEAGPARPANRIALEQRHELLRALKRRERQLMTQRQIDAIAEGIEEKPRTLDEKDPDYLYPSLQSQVNLCSRKLFELGFDIVWMDYDVEARDKSDGWVRTHDMITFLCVKNTWSFVAVLWYACLRFWPGKLLFLLHCSSVCSCLCLARSTKHTGGLRCGKT